MRNVLPKERKNSFIYTFSHSQIYYFNRAKSAYEAMSPAIACDLGQTWKQEEPAVTTQDLFF